MLFIVPTVRLVSQLDVLEEKFVRRHKQCGVHVIDAMLLARYTLSNAFNRYLERSEIKIIFKESECFEKNILYCRSRTKGNYNDERKRQKTRKSAIPRTKYPPV